MYKISDFNIGDIVVLNDESRGKVIGILNHECQDELDPYGDSYCELYLKGYGSASGILGTDVIDVESIESKGV